MRFFALLFCLIGALIQMPSCWAQSFVTVPQWSNYDIVLYSAPYPNPYTDVIVTATFTGPSGIPKTIQGFWDGGNIFKVRFTPTAQGTWRYSIVSSPHDAGLTKSGTIRAVKPVAGSHGFLRRDPDNPYSFVFDDHTRYFLLGQTYYGLVLNALDNGDWRTAVTNSKKYGFTKVRVLLFNWVPGTGASYGHPYMKPFTTDHDHVNLAYWQKMDEVVSYIQSQGMIADLILFSDDPASWGTSAQNDRYVRLALARFAAYRNLIWCLSNEWNYTGQPQSEIDRLGAIVSLQDPYAYNKVARRLLSVHQQTRIDFQFYDSPWPTLAEIQYGPRNQTSPYGDVWGNLGIAYNLGHDMPVVNEEYGYIDPLNVYKLRDGTAFSEHRTSIRNAIWGIVMAGGYGTFGGDTTAISLTSIPMFSGDWFDQPSQYGDVRVLSSFMQSVSYWQMSPQNSVVSGKRVYVLGMKTDYIIYDAVGQSFEVRMSGPCDVARIDPRTGETVSLPSIPGGRNQLSPPDEQDYVYHLTGHACQ